MIRLLGSYMPTGATASSMRTLATQSKRRVEKDPKINPKVACVVLGVLGVSSFWLAVQNEPPKEYKGPNGKAFDDND